MQRIMTHAALRAAICAIFGGLSMAADAIPGIGPTGPMQVVHDGLKFTEGPAANVQGEIYFVDGPDNRIYRVNPGGDPIVVMEDSAAINGLMFATDGRLWACQAAKGRIVSIDIASGSPKTRLLDVVADTYRNDRFIRPNDLTLDSAGGVYFTDPRLGKSTKFQDEQAFYYVAYDGAVTRLGDDLNYPNGILLSPDEKTLYVLPFMGTELMAYDVILPGKIGPGRVHFKMPARENGKRGGGDGLAVDTQGNLYLTAPVVKAICVVNPQGEELGRIPVPNAPANCAFGGPEFKTLYITAREKVFAVPMEAVGHVVARAAP